MKTRPITIERIEPRMRYATALLIDMSIGPILRSGPHVWRFHSSDGSNFLSSLPAPSATEGSVSASRISTNDRRFTLFASPPK